MLGFWYFNVFHIRMIFVPCSFELHVVIWKWFDLVFGINLLVTNFFLPRFWGWMSWNQCRSYFFFALGDHWFLARHFRRGPLQGTASQIASCVRCAGWQEADNHQGTSLGVT